jgi:4-hydroxyphenylacetate 3-monooxygenase
VKFDFIAGLLLKSVEMTGAKDFRGVQTLVGEALAWRAAFWSLTDSMASHPEPWVDGTVLPNLEAAGAYRVLATMAYPRLKEIVQQALGSALIYLNSHASDFSNPSVRPLIDRFIRGSNGRTAEERVKLLKLMWDAVGSEFASRHELYERNYAGNHENIRIENIAMATATGTIERLKTFAETCMSEYDLKGWTVPDLINPTDVSFSLNQS